MGFVCMANSANPEVWTENISLIGITKKKDQNNSTIQNVSLMSGMPVIYTELHK